MINTTNVMNPVRLPADIADELGALQARSERLVRSSRRYLGVASTAAVASAVMGALAWWLGPDAALKAAHLPSEIAELFSAAVPGSNGSILGDSIFGSILLLGTKVVGNASVVIGICLVGSTLYGLARDEGEMPSIAGLMAGLISGSALIVAPLVMSAVLGIGDGRSSQSDSESDGADSSPRQTFIADVEGANYSAVQKALQEIEASETVTSYMLAQVALAQANKAGKPLEPSGKTALVEHVKRLDEALSKKLVSFTVSPQAVYALEVAALGKPSSGIAVSYLSESQHKAGLARAGQSIAGLLALAAGLVGGGMLLVGRRIRSRLDRILPLLGQIQSIEDPVSQGVDSDIFSTADADTIIQMGANLLPKVDGDAKNWQERALNCWRGMVPALCWLRDHEGMEISIRTFVDYLSLAKLEELYTKGYKLAQAAPDGQWPEAFEGLKSYLEVGLPGFKLERCLKKHGALPKAAPGPGGKAEPMDQDATTYDQHGYRVIQLTPSFSTLLAADQSIQV